MRKLAIVLIVLLMIPAVSVLAAEEPVGIEYFDVLIRPEFDSPDVLIMLQVYFAGSGDGISAELNLPPDASGLVVARIDADGKPVVSGIEFSSQQTAEALVVSIESETTGIWLEYYDPNLNISGDMRDYTFTWQQNYAADIFDVRVQQPYNSLNFSTQPALASTWTDDFGMLNHGQGFDNLGAGEIFTFSVSYDKADTSTSMEALGNQSTLINETAPESPATEENSWLVPVLIAASEAAFLIPVLIAASAAALLVILFIFRKDIARIFSGKSKPAAVGARFCHGCGKKARKADVFCRSCGKKLRK